MSDYTSYTDYFEDLATQHVDIDHDLNAVPKKKAFFRINIEEVLSGLRSLTVEKTFNFILVNYAYSPGLQGADNLNNYDGGFMIVHKTKDKDFEDEKEKITECEKIANEIIKRIKFDSQTQAADENSMWYKSQNAIKDFHVSIARGPNFEYVGVQVFFQFKNFFDCTLDDTKWADQAGPKDPNDWSILVNP